MEKRDSDNKVFMQSPGSRYLAMQGKLLHRANTSVNGRIGSTLQSKNKGRCIGRKQESGHGPTFRVIGEAQNCTMALYNTTKVYVLYFCLCTA